MSNKGIVNVRKEGGYNYCGIIAFVRNKPIHERMIKLINNRQQSSAEHELSSEKEESLDSKKSYSWSQPISQAGSPPRRPAFVSLAVNVLSVSGV